MHKQIDYPVLYLKKQEERRLLQGHLWIYSNEIDVARSPLKTFKAGDLVQVQTATGQPLGIAYINPHCLLCARLLTRSVEPIQQTWFIQQLKKALTWRESVFNKPYYRLVYGESDHLPGLIIDRFNDTAVVQLNTAGMENLREPIITAIDFILKPKRLILRNDGGARKIEGLPAENICLYGDAEQPLEIEENNARFVASAMSGQKTGWFYDHRENRARLLPWVKNKRVLDVFSYVGGWGIQAAVAGARSVVCVDSSASALEYVKKNATLNNVQDRVTTLKQDAFDALTALRDQENFDVIILDPPAFVKQKKDKNNGLVAYQRLYQQAAKLLSKNGMVIAASCSSFVSSDELLQLANRASIKANQNWRLVLQGSNAPDHPIHPAIIETAYLKSLFLKN